MSYNSETNQTSKKKTMVSSLPLRQGRGPKGQWTHVSGKLLVLAMGDLSLS